LRRYLGKTVTILIDIPSASSRSGREAYGGVVKEVTDGVVILDPNNPNYFVKEIAIMADLILSIRIVDPDKYRR